MVGPLDAHCFAVDVAVELLEEGFVLGCVLHCLEVVSHLGEELRLVDPAVELAESFVASVVCNPGIHINI